MTLICEREGACSFTKGIDKILDVSMMVPIGGSFYFGFTSPLLSLDLLFIGYFICILVPRYDHVFHECYTDYFMVNISEMLMHAHVIGTRPFFPLLCSLGIRLLR